MCCIVVFDYSPLSTAQSIPASEKVTLIIDTLVQGSHYTYHCFVIQQNVRMLGSIKRNVFILTNSEKVYSIATLIELENLRYIIEAINMTEKSRFVIITTVFIVLTLALAGVIGIYSQGLKGLPYASCATTSSRVTGVYFIFNC